MSKFKFKVGDKVRVLPFEGRKGMRIRSVVYPTMVTTWVTRMTGYVGRVYTIKDIATDEGCMLDGCLRFAFLPDWLELVEEDTQTIDLTNLNKPYKELSIEEKVGLFEAELRGEAIETRNIGSGTWFSSIHHHEFSGYHPNDVYRVRPPKSSKQLHKEKLQSQINKLQKEINKIDVD